MNEEIKKLGKQLEDFKGLLDELKKIDITAKDQRQPSKAKAAKRQDAETDPAPPPEDGQKKPLASGQPNARAFLKAVIAEVHENPSEYQEISWIFELGAKYQGIREAVENIQKEIYAISYDVRALRGRLRREIVS